MKETYEEHMKSHVKPEDEPKPEATVAKKEAVVEVAPVAEKKKGKK